MPMFHSRHLCIRGRTGQAWMAENGLYVVYDLTPPRDRAAPRRISPAGKDPRLAAEWRRRCRPAVQPPGERPDQVAQDRRLAEARCNDEPARGGSGMMIIRAALTGVLAL